MKHSWWGIIIDKYKRILLIKRIINDNMFPCHRSLPSWKWIDLENPKQTAKREVYEEVWLNFTPTTLFMSSILEHSWIQIQTYRYLWNWSWKVNIQDGECDWFAWYTYDETKSLKIAFDYRDMIDKLYEEGIIN